MESLRSLTMPREKRRGGGRRRRRCAYLDLQLGRNSRRLSCDDIKRDERKKEEGRGSWTAQKTVSGLYERREKIGKEGFRLLGEGCKGTNESVHVREND